MRTRTPKAISRDRRRRENHPADQHLRVIFRSAELSKSDAYVPPGKEEAGGSSSSRSTLLCRISPAFPSLISGDAVILVPLVPLVLVSWSDRPMDSRPGGRRPDPCAARPRGGCLPTSGPIMVSDGHRRAIVSVRGRAADVRGVVRHRRCSRGDPAGCRPPVADRPSRARSSGGGQPHGDLGRDEGLATDRDRPLARWSCARSMDREPRSGSTRR